MPYGAKPLSKEVLPQRNAPGRGFHEENEFGKPGPGGPVRRNQQDLLLVLIDLAQCLCKQGETYTCVKPEASCVPVLPCRGGPRSGRNTAGSERTREKQTGHTNIANESTPDQPDRLGMESPFIGERELS